MKNIIGIFAVALVMFTAVSCEKNEVIPGGNVEGKIVTLAASINNGGTKTSLGVKDGDTYPVLWSKGDVIAVMQGSNKYEFTLKEGEGTTSATFQCESAEGFDPTKSYRACYPYDIVTRVTEQTVYCNIPDTQVYVSNNFSNGSMPMTAVSSNEGLVFEPLFGALKLQLIGDNDTKIVSIEIYSNAEPLSGELFRYTYNSSGTINFILQDEGHKQYLKLDCGENGVQLSNNVTEFIIPIRRNEERWTTTNNVFITDQNGNRRVVRDNLAKTIIAGNIIKMAPINFGPQENEYIVEKDGKKTYYGAGIEKYGIIWAPVNCGFEPSTSTSEGYPWGQYFQWGSNNGLGYSAFTTSNVNPVPAQPDANTFYTNWNKSDEWRDDPCPDGWEIPTTSQLQNVTMAIYKATPEDMFSNQSGSKIDNLYFPHAGCINNGSSSNQNRQYGGYYWAKNTVEGKCKCGFLSGGYFSIQVSTYNNAAYAIRCVKIENPA